MPIAHRVETLALRLMSHNVTTLLFSSQSLSPALGGGDRYPKAGGGVYKRRPLIPLPPLKAPIHWPIFFGPPQKETYDQL